ncbi:SagB/ThcOx family dehydrogenase [Roseibium sp. Sym1]|uniref:SagB/ThcOx family dehydrogenase n=1 Tax=Roseibium sp. Sym1 TaxID=3016006 RepID=UPI0022B5D0D4|nr:SagB/ThcOx family dehydrogenase [Roseibium sp. Sym1]
MKHPPAFSDFELAWTYHRNSSRWAHNAEETSGADDVPEPGAEAPSRPFQPLPAPPRVTTGLSDVLANRCSCREFAQDPISLETVSGILFHGYGVWGQDHWNTAEFLERPVPSGGGMYPLELYLVSRNTSGLSNGIYHYQPLLKGLERNRDLTLPAPLMRYLFMGQYPPMLAPALIVITSRMSRSLKKYGDRGYRYVLLEAGHVAQNINLACTGLGAQSLNIGGFFDDEVGALCHCPENEEVVLYAVAIGHGTSEDRHKLRFSEDT